MIQLDKSKLNSSNTQLQLARHHAQEWQAIFQLEIQTRHAIGTRHKQETTDASLHTNSSVERAKLLLKHVDELNQLKCSNHLNRQVLRKRQEQEKTSLNEPVPPIPYE